MQVFWGHASPELLELPACQCLCMYVGVPCQELRSRPHPEYVSSRCLLLLLLPPLGRRA